MKTFLEMGIEDIEQTVSKAPADISRERGEYARSDLPKEEKNSHYRSLSERHPDQSDNVLT